MSRTPLPRRRHQLSAIEYYVCRNLEPGLEKNYSKARKDRPNTTTKDTYQSFSNIET
jgi:hypothetical protein